MRLLFREVPSFVLGAAPAPYRVYLNADFAKNDVTYCGGQSESKISYALSSEMLPKEDAGL